ncbi:30S ribosomal protein S18 [Candidatus Woesebacteria bacterium CG22_combo_CG10-13_8_21_14_all_39_10]|uniref:Small ribosomal subunit protein bS18 n=4 Tax=Candidatus Woeseibacteriota TaxID=1752722 RepID=A0A2M7X9T0_9BACT|nr:MAG: 30S ribosomal protein S18 [Candidatus Woesebacteria bacterium CG22_combo_CG10-13_8_21_14_all_39_10]PIU71782.1 MAG: 30S ribosomal protein S18 [Candidatus Woesebacteria bacterium CG06_land_8_20_14_3_00_39_27]PIZ47191.1 MAG: 30S ribosomal protein S18 [Candidatus Woesebacteria bacterium CG_4_10_14_0_2_um_filter_39_14]PJA42905.1 MAG: 30S ribosomal protein S18 [Candidatus Woesebacteria bacterium CG_4_9_14_3_um_filter_39_10]
MQKGKKRRAILKLKPVRRNCMFCKTESEPDYKDFETLKKYVSERVKILGKARTGVCAKHQRKISREVKRARTLGLLPFTLKL